MRVGKYSKAMELHSCNAIKFKYLGTPFSQSKGPDFEVSVGPEGPPIDDDYFFFAGDAGTTEVPPPAILAPVPSTTMH